jgi:hypothetical protein
LASGNYARQKKDVHLLEAAHGADRIICSCDATACDYFRRLVDLVDWVGDIAWIDPDQEADEAIAWLRSRRVWRRRLRD